VSGRIFEELTENWGTASRASFPAETRRFENFTAEAFFG
jgi:hypothetical protein